tara:strand:+ start:494 stop:940 length:447 start_codon:yes stop_codon:yes gene_type:complete
MTAHQGFEDAQTAIDYITGGKATFTLTSAKSGNHFTFKANTAKSDDAKAYPPLFIKVLDGPDNSWNGDWLYLGYIAADSDALKAGRKGHPEAPSYKALDWTLRKLFETGLIPAEVTIQHEGSCCRCNRQLTHPNSIASGIGPECSKKG